MFLVKKHMLRNLKPTDFDRELFKTNMSEYNQLGPSASQAFMARYDVLFTPKSDKKDE